MGKIKTRALLMAAVLALSSMFPLTAWAAREKIDKVTVKIEIDGKLSAGEPVGNVEAIVSDNAPYYVDSVYFYDEGSTWHKGDTPKIVIDLIAEDDYYFSSTSKSYFNISGDGSPSYSSAKRYDDNETMELTVKLKPIGGTSTSGPSSTDLWWDDNEARWDEIDDAKRYEIRLYRDGSQVTTVKSDDNDYDFTSKMTKKGDYSFRVRAVYSSSSYSSWSSFSEENYVSSSDASDNADDDHSSGSSSGGPGGNNSSSGPGGSKGPGSSGSTLPSSGWVLNSTGWWYRFSDGTNPANSWQNINHRWYFFANSGYMHIGWLQQNNNWYYLRLSNGDMIVGWYPINGAWYYFNDNGVMHTGWLQLNNTWYYLQPNGVMATGWNNINNVWYFMDASGAMYANAWTPDGHYVNASGAMVQ